MSRKFMNRRYGRRQFLRNMGMGAAGVASAGIFNACAPAGAPAASQSSEPAVAAVDSPWITGLVSSDSSATFKYTGWEGEAEMRKWLHHFDKLKHADKFQIYFVKFKQDFGLKTQLHQSITSDPSALLQ